MALVLLSGAGLMLQTLRRQLEVDPGFKSKDILAARLTLPRDTYTAERRALFAERLEERLRALPGVTDTTVAADLPLRGIESGGYLTAEGSMDEVAYFCHRVAPSYFETLGIQLRSGRTFAASDGPNAPQVAVVSAHMARRLWPNQDPLGRRFRLAGASRELPWVEVVGIAEDVRFRDLTGDMYAPSAEWTSTSHLRSSRTRRSSSPSQERRAELCSVTASVAWRSNWIPHSRFATWLH